jgi:hypothetical protein
MNIIHFDLGSHMAFAHNGNSDIGLIECGHADFIGTRAARAAQILQWLVALKDNLAANGIKFNVCHYERPFSRGFDATRCGWGIAGLIEAVFGSDCVVLDTTPQSIKSFALGSKKIVRTKMTSRERHDAAAAEKLAMIARAQELGYSGENEHEADAFLGLKYAETYCRKETQCLTPKTSQASTKSTGRSMPSRAAQGNNAQLSKTPTRKRSRSA